MTDLGEVLERLGLAQYLEKLREEGFEKWDTVLDITESDLATLNVKLGHRRILQREIASARGVQPHQPLNLFFPGAAAAEDFEQSEDPNSPRPSREAGKSMAPTGKRKYRRHPKPDENAPEKPPSAYVMFANRVRDELKGQSLSFTDIAKLVGERWKVLDSEDKESYEYQASVAKEKYNSELQEYKKTESYRDYLKYLSDFKSKQEGKENLDDPARKRPRLESLPSIPSTSSLGTVSTTGGSAGSAASLAAQQTHSGFPSSDSGSASLGSGSTGIPISSVVPQPKMSSPPPQHNATIASDFAQFGERSETQGHETESQGHYYHLNPVHPHIQQQSSYIRHQPGLQALHNNRSASMLPSPAVRRHSMRIEDVSPAPTAPVSSSSSTGTTAPSLVPMTPMTPSTFDDHGGRSHRSLPPPKPGASGGYFDRYQTSQQRSSLSQAPQTHYNLKSHSPPPPPHSSPPKPAEPDPGIGNLLPPPKPGSHR